MGFTVLDFSDKKRGKRSKISSHSERLLVYFFQNLNLGKEDEEDEKQRLLGEKVKL